MNHADCVCFWYAFMMVMCKQSVIQWDHLHRCKQISWRCAEVSNTSVFTEIHTPDIHADTHTHLTTSLGPLESRGWGCWFHKLLIPHSHVYLTNRTKRGSVTTGGRSFWWSSGKNRKAFLYRLVSIKDRENGAKYSRRLKKQDIRRLFFSRKK
jgi:hypothetical protein